MYSTVKISSTFSKYQTAYVVVRRTVQKRDGQKKQKTNKNHRTKTTYIKCAMTLVSLPMTSCEE